MTKLVPKLGFSRYTESKLALTFMLLERFGRLVTWSGVRWSMVPEPCATPLIYVAVERRREGRGGEERHGGMWPLSFSSLSLSLSLSHWKGNNWRSNCELDLGAEGEKTINRRNQDNEEKARKIDRLRNCSISPDYVLVFFDSPATVRDIVFLREGREGKEEGSW